MPPDLTDEGTHPRTLKRLEITIDLALYPDRDAIRVVVHALEQYLAGLEDIEGAQTVYLGGVPVLRSRPVYSGEEAAP